VAAASTAVAVVVSTVAVVATVVADTGKTPFIDR
jgi:hypothetical protein